MWDTWNATQHHHHMGLWEWESSTHGGGTIWDEYDEIHGFPNDEAPDSLAGRMAKEKQRREYPSITRRYKDKRRTPALGDPPVAPINRVCHAPLPYPGLPGTDRGPRAPVPKAPPTVATTPADKTVAATRAGGALTRELLCLAVQPVGSLKRHRGRLPAPTRLHGGGNRVGQPPRRWVGRPGHHAVRPLTLPRRVRLSR